jgi:CheY-like chemotaxis protein
LSSTHARGLAVSQRIICEMGGSISVESAPNRGAVFRVVLPPRSSAVQARTVALSAGWAETPDRPRVMVVDDEPLVCELIKTLLEEGYHVEVFTSSREALGQLLAGEHFDLVLCDLMMPELTGMDVHAELKRVDPAQAERMVFMTGGTFTERAHRFIDGVGAPTLTKPFRREQLHETLARRLAELSGVAIH